MLVPFGEEDTEAREAKTLPTSWGDTQSQDADPRIYLQSLSSLLPLLQQMRKLLFYEQMHNLQCLCFHGQFENIILVNALQ